MAGCAPCWLVLGVGERGSASAAIKILNIHNNFTLQHNNTLENVLQKKRLHEKSDADSDWFSSIFFLALLKLNVLIKYTETMIYSFYFSV